MRTSRRPAQRRDGVGVASGAGQTKEAGVESLTLGRQGIRVRQALQKSLRLAAVPRAFPIGLFRNFYHGAPGWLRWLSV